MSSFAINISSRTSLTKNANAPSVEAVNADDIKARIINSLYGAKYTQIRFKMIHLSY